MNKYINPFTDFGFKKIFGSEVNKDLLIDFLNTLLADKGTIISLTYLKNEHIGRRTEDRKTVFDLYCETDKGETFIVEMQKAKQTFFKDRTLYYTTFPIQAQAKKDVRNSKDKSKNYTWDYQLQSVYSVAVMDFAFDDTKPDKVKHDIMLMDRQDHTIFYDKLRLIYLEMPHFTKKIDELETQEDKWLFVLKNLSFLEEIPEKLKDKIFTKLFETADMTNYTQNLLSQYHDSLRDYRDLQNSLDTYKREGREEGRQEGIKLIALNLLKNGLSDEFVHQNTGLSLAEIAQIRKDNSL
jgi:predicted transposase/invertase (TIGR01784 family)